MKETSHGLPSEKLSEEHSEDLVLFGDVTTKELAAFLGVGSKSLLALESNRSVIRVPRIKEVNKVDIHPHQSLHY